MNRGNIPISRNLLLEHQHKLQQRKVRKVLEAKPAQYAEDGHQRRVDDQERLSVSVALLFQVLQQEGDDLPVAGEEL